MPSDVGWILDSYVRDAEAIIWLRTVDGAVLKITDIYRPNFYILPKSQEMERELYDLLLDHPNIVNLVFEEKYTMLGDSKKQRLLNVVVDGAYSYKRVLQAVTNLPQVQELYNVNLLHAQQYLFKNKIAPTSKVEAEYDRKNHIISMDLLDDSKELSPPPFSILMFDVYIQSQLLTPDSVNDPIVAIEVNCGGENIIIEGQEHDILNEFSTFVETRDPDFLICAECDRHTFPYLFDRTRFLSLRTQLGRDKCDLSRLCRPLPYWIQGRVAIDRQYFEEFGIAGLVERSRFSILPPRIASRWTANRVIDSRNCYEIMHRGYVIPQNVGYYEYIRTIEEVVARDRGGLIIAPKIGIFHENVAELDFESEYPNLIVRDCLSYETVTPAGVVPRNDALLPFVTKQILGRRLYFKRLSKNFLRDSNEWLWCEQRQLALKLILVCLYGTSGCCWNRFGNILCFEEINRRSRETLLKTKEIAQSQGFEIVYADTDSIFVKKPGATKEDYKELSSLITEKMKIPIALDHHYKFLVLSPLESDPSSNMEAQKHYFGLLTNGELLVRGIELRRHDTPLFINDFQERLIKILFDAKTTDESSTEGYRKALSFVVETINKIMSGEVPLEQLVISKILRKPLSEYSSMLPHVSAAAQLIQQGKVVKKGEKIDLIYVNIKSHNPFRRVAPYTIYDKNQYDREKYRELVLNAAETVLCTFGFSRHQFGFDVKNLSLTNQLQQKLNHQNHPNSLK